MPESFQKNLSEAVHYLQSIYPSQPEVALVLGSGLGALADAVENAVAVNASDVPHMTAASVEGHRGRLVFGELGGKTVVVIQGRLHMYEGHNVSTIAFPIRLVNALGASCLFVTNASGGINPEFTPGTLMWITDHINQTGMRLSEPEIDADDSIEQARSPEWPGRSRVDYYDKSWIDRVERRAFARGISTRRGTYLWTRGPSYETKAEIRAFRVMGADAVGMSTVPEVVQARLCGMSIIGLSTITNAAAGMNSEPLNHDEVIETGQMVRKALESLAILVLEEAPGPATNRVE